MEEKLCYQKNCQMASLETDVWKEVKSPMAWVNNGQTKCPYSNASGTLL